MEEVHSEDRGGLTGQELPPGLPGAPGCRIDARVLENLPHRLLSGAKDAHGIGLFAALTVPMGNPGEAAWSAAAPCR